MTSGWPTNLPRSRRTSQPDIQQIAKLWSSLSNTQRSRKLEKMTEIERLLLKRAIRDLRRTMTR
jgi:hypothetical protein